MPQIQLPIFPASGTAITGELAFQQRDGQFYYFNGHLPVFTHAVEDIASFRFFTSQLVANGSASQSRISKAFGVPLVTVKRACEKPRLEGASAFFRPAPTVWRRTSDFGFKTPRGKIGLPGDDDARTARGSSQLPRPARLSCKMATPSRSCSPNAAPCSAVVHGRANLRRLNEPGHQTSILSTDYRGEMISAAARHETRKGEALARIQQRQSELEQLEARRKATARHVQIKELPEGQRIRQPRAGRKPFINTVKLIAYRGETALVRMARERMRRQDDARGFVRGLMRTTINLRPDHEAGELRVELHGQANPVHDGVAAHLCEELNATETHSPGTNLRLEFVPLGSSHFPRVRDV